MLSCANSAVRHRFRHWNRKSSINKILPDRSTTDAFVKAKKPNQILQHPTRNLCPAYRSVIYTQLTPFSRRVACAVPKRLIQNGWQFWLVNYSSDLPSIIECLYSCFYSFSYFHRLLLWCLFVFFVIIDHRLLFWVSFLQVSNVHRIRCLPVWTRLFHFRFTAFENYKNIHSLCKFS